MNSPNEKDRRCPVPLTQGQVAWVSPEDLERVRRHKWVVLRKPSGRLYAQANVKVEGVWRRVQLHRFVMNAERGQLIDHRDRNGLNNTRSNLRIATREQNQHNSGPRGPGRRFKGVTWHKGSGKWLAQIMAGREYRYLGLHLSEQDAARAYDRAAKELHGEFARLNFPEMAASETRELALSARRAAA